MVFAPSQWRYAKFHRGLRAGNAPRGHEEIAGGRTTEIRRRFRRRVDDGEAAVARRFTSQPAVAAGLPPGRLQLAIRMRQRPVEAVSTRVELHAHLEGERPAGGVVGAVGGPPVREIVGVVLRFEQVDHVRTKRLRRLTIRERGISAGDGELVVARWTEMPSDERAMNFVAVGKSGWSAGRM